MLILWQEALELEAYCALRLVMILIKTETRPQPWSSHEANNNKRCRIKPKIARPKTSSRSQVEKKENRNKKKWLSSRNNLLNVLRCLFAVFLIFLLLWAPFYFNNLSRLELLSAKRGGMRASGKAREWAATHRAKSSKLNRATRCGDTFSAPSERWNLEAKRLTNNEYSKSN